ncbi:MAG: hypothetical protein AVDCRST_MAG69-2811 [uncultured Solirubrobacteraceae bacterium]|uniref:Peptidase C51 domain-containing protein n=1 Tax=uncultured Solirubrobacteraceae bacterium TaxID=1162706 RepID=A0A6J4T9E8_9ACTN|nr:MAG: hypothetical protein AVDCRST_MAG69-2811 [uncultured Solirubrobacteraceae bacterium]
MSLEIALARIGQLQSLLSPPVPSAAPAGPASSAQAAPAGAPASFASVLGQQGLVTAPAATPVAVGGTSAGRAALAAAQREVGVAEEPPGSNDSPRIAQYRQSTAGSMVAPWCAYFVSWAGREAGAPIGDSGQGLGAVSDVWAWAQRSGKAIPAGTAPPQPGDLIVWNGRHIGIVESVAADGSVHTIEGNSSDAVTRRVHGPDGDGATGYVRLG